MRDSTWTFLPETFGACSCRLWNGESKSASGQAQSQLAMSGQTTKLLLVCMPSNLARNAAAFSFIPFGLANKSLLLKAQLISANLLHASKSLPGLGTADPHPWADLRAPFSWQRWRSCGCVARVASALP